MSNTIRGSKPPGYEFWSKRPGRGRGPLTKKGTHRTERQQGRVLPSDAAWEYQEEKDRFQVVEDSIEDTLAHYRRIGVA